MTIFVLRGAAGAVSKIIEQGRNRFDVGRCGRVVRRFRVPVGLLGTPAPEIPAAFVSGGGAIGIGGQIAFSVFPLMRLARRR